MLWIWKTILCAWTATSGVCNNLQYRRTSQLLFYLQMWRSLHTRMYLIAQFQDEQYHLEIVQLSGSVHLELWATENPHVTRPHAYQKWYSANMWVGTVNDFLIDPYLLPKRLNGQYYPFSGTGSTRTTFFMFRSPFVTECVFSMLGRQPISEMICEITWMPLLGCNEMDGMDQSLRDPDLPIYRASITF